MTGAEETFHQSSDSVHYCERKGKIKTGEAWDQGQFMTITCVKAHFTLGYVPAVSAGSIVDEGVCYVVVANGGCCYLASSVTWLCHWP